MIHPFISIRAEKFYCQDKVSCCFLQLNYWTRTEQFSFLISHFVWNAIHWVFYILLYKLSLKTNKYIFSLYALLDIQFNRTIANTSWKNMKIWISNIAVYVFLFDYTVYGNQSTFSKENELTCRFCLTTQKLKKLKWSYKWIDKNEWVMWNMHFI